MGQLPLAGHPILRASDVDDAQARMGRLFCSHTLRPAGRGAGRLAVVVVNAVWLQRISVHAVSYGPAVAIGVESSGDFYVVAAPLAGVARGGRGREEIEATASRAAVHGPGEPARVDWNAGCVQLAARIDRPVLTAYLGGLLGYPVDTPPRFALGWDLATGPGRGFWAMLRALARELEHPDGWLGEPALCAQWEGLLLSGLLYGHQHSRSAALHGPQRTAPPQVVRRVVELIDTHPELPWSAAELARASGVGARAIQKAFAEHLGIPPHVYVRQRRLARARAELVAADPATATVRQIAASCGFAHLSRFAAAYRAGYGEYPSDTLHRP